MQRKKRLYANNGGSGDLALSFSVPLLTTLAASLAHGSGTPTFTRATTAYVEDFEGLLKPVLSGEARFKGARRVRNLVTGSSENFAVAQWGKNTVTLTAGVADPFGGTAASTLTADGANSYIYQDAGAQTGSCTNSIYIRRRTGTGDIQIIKPGASATRQTVAVTTSWQRFSATEASGAATHCGVQIVTSGDEVDIAFGMIERVTGQSNQNPSEYVSVGVLSAPYHGANVDGVKYFDTENGNTVASNVVTEATGAAISTSVLLGYLAEGARTNLCLQSQTFANASWVEVGVNVISEGSVVAPDGTATADTITGNGANSAHLVAQPNPPVSGSTQTLSVYAKAGTGNYLILGAYDSSVAENFYVKVFDLALGVVGESDVGTSSGTVSGATITALENGWYRCTVTGVATMGSPVFQIGMAGAATGNTFNQYGQVIFVSSATMNLWGAQVETAAFASTYIPTTTIAVARNADVLTYPFSGNFSNAAGAVVYEVTASSVVWAAIINQAGVNVDGAGAPAYLGNAGTTSGIRGNDGTNTVNGPTGAPSGTMKHGVSWGGSSLVVAANGSTTSGTFDGSMGGSSAIGIGTRTNGAAQPGASVRNVRIYNRALSDAALQAMTT